ncbi:hypothetical protein [Cupriavidus consociatus]|uniref:hypothetical protein n=1 Tax=Cupriavidus consociatus TaxID=2821357 RepID=UPI001AE94CDF|nr:MULTISPECIES: hypothetical protein [unclassified Cupriavidus]MBP0624753.1 hypothetical protein [Cupriavidus sp. LEh25]MDK2661469.1 hypothetical protein [Cupriavidus sp. LEh21]
MPQKGFTAIVNRLHIHAMRSTATSEVQAGQSDAQFFHVYRREASGNMTLVERNLSFDSALDYCLAPATLH